MAVDEIIVNQIPSGIPDDFHGEEGLLVPGYNMQNAQRVNESLYGIYNQLSLSHWSGSYLYAYYDFIIDMPVANRASSLGSTIFFDYMGYTWHIICTELGDVAVGGFFDIFIDVGKSWTHNQIIDYLCLGMDDRAKGVGPFGPWAFAHFGDNQVRDIDSPLFGFYQTIRIEGVHGGVNENDFSGNGNVIGGGVFGTAKYGGYTLRSPDNDGTALHISIYNNESGNFEFTSGFHSSLRGNPVSEHAGGELPTKVLFKKKPYYCYTSPHQWIIFPKSPGGYVIMTTKENQIGVEDYHIAGLCVPADQAYGGDMKKTSNNGYGWDIPNIRNPITYTGFMMATPRGFLTEDTDCATCVNDFFKLGQFPGLDCGVTYLVYNTRFHEAGLVVTTAERPIRYSAIVALTEGNSFFNREHGVHWTATKSQVYGYAWNMYMTTQGAGLGTVIEDIGGFFFAYRRQYTPCEATLWLRIGSPTGDIEDYVGF